MAATMLPAVLPEDAVALDLPVQGAAPGRRAGAKRRDRATREVENQRTEPYFSPVTFFQSASNEARPWSVRGCLRHFLSAPKGTVAMSAPMRAAWVT